MAARTATPDARTRGDAPNGAGRLPRVPMRGDRARRTPRIWLVSELLRAARLAIESRFADVRVEGEVSGLKRSGGGHLYFCLKDAQGQLDCVLYAREAARLKFQLEEGMAVRCRGRLTLYEARGRFQMTVVGRRADGRGRARPRLRAAQEPSSPPRASSTRPASARCRSCRAAWAS